MVQHDISKKERFVQTLHAYLDHSRPFISYYIYISFIIFLTATHWHWGPLVLEDISKCQMPLQQEPAPRIPHRPANVDHLDTGRTASQMAAAVIQKNGDNMEPPRCKTHESSKILGALSAFLSPNCYVMPVWHWEETTLCACTRFHTDLQRLSLGINTFRV